jgi:hypothetical protein
MKASLVIAAEWAGAGSVLSASGHAVLHPDDAARTTMG